MPKPLSEKKQISSTFYLTHYLDLIMKRWADTVRERVPASKDLDQKELYNSLPQFLVKLSEIISTTGGTIGQERFSEELVEICRDHGAQRSKIESYSLDQVILEQRLLRKTVLDFLEEQNCSLNKSELDKLLESIDYAMIQSATEFTSRLGFEKSRRLNELEAHFLTIEEQLRKSLSEHALSRDEIDSLKSERELRERFVSTLTHDLRTPLTSVKAAGELILKKAEDAALSRSLASRVVNGANRVDKMIRDLLDTNQIRAGRNLPLAIVQCDLVEIILASIDELATHHGNRFIFKSPSSVTGHWSPDDLRRVIENLALNAVKYGDPVAPVSIRLEEIGESIKLSVHNEGNPLNAREQSVLFRHFERSRSAQTDGKRGWGIGLTLVRGVAEAHGGKAWVESSVDKGTTFTVEPPRDARLPKIAA